MNLTDFIKLPAKEAHLKLREGLKNGKIEVKQFKELAREWLEAHNWIFTGMGWQTKESMAEEGIFLAGNEWFYEGELKEITVKEDGKMIQKMVLLPVKAIECARRQKDVVEIYNASKAKEVKGVTTEIAEQILLGD